MIATTRQSYIMWLSYSLLGLVLLSLSACGGGSGAPDSTPGFTISLDKASLSIEAGLSATITLSLAAQNGFNDSVLVTASDLPEGVTVSTLSLAAGETTGTLSFEVTAATALGTYRPTLTATSGKLSKSAQVTLEVTAPSTTPTFTLNINPVETTIALGGSRSIAITLIRQNSFADAVTISTSGLPTGISTAPLTIAAGETSGTLTLIAASDAVTGKATVSINGTSGELSNSVSLNLEVIAPAPAPDFTMRLEPTSLSLSKNASQNVSVILERQNGFAEAVTITASNLPTGVTASPLTIAADASSGTLSLSAGDNASTSASEVTVTAAGGGLSRNATLALTVTAPTPSFSLSINPTSLELEQGESKEVTVSLDKNNGFDSSVAVTVTGLPAGVSVNALNIAAGESTGTLSLSAAANADVGSTTLNVKGSSGALISQVSLDLTVKAPESFSLSLEPASVSLSRGASQNLTVKLNKEGGFDADVAITVSGLPTGVSVNSLTIAAGESAGTLKLSASNAATLGDATLNVMGKSGSLTADADLALEVTGPAPTFELSLSDSDVSVDRGTSKAVTVTIARKNGFDQAVSVSVSGLPPGVTVNDLTIAAGAITGELTLSAGNTASAGQSTLSVTGTSGTLEQSETLSLTVTVAANEPPTITKPADQTVIQNTDSDTKTLEVSYTLTDDQPTSALSVSASSSNADIVAGSSFACTPEKCSFDVKHGQAGTTTLTLTVTDADGALATTTFSVSVGPRLVTNNNDSGDGSLRQVIQDADKGDVIGFASTQEIVVTDELNISKNVTIDGTTTNSSLDGGNSVRILTLQAGAEVTISRLTLLFGNSGLDNGGCIANAGTLILNAVSVIQCINGAFGGGIYNEGTLRLNGGSVNGNSADVGGGIYNDAGSLTTDGTAFYLNTATGFGGGALYNGNASVATLANSTIGSSNGPNNARDQNGGGILNDNSSLTLQNTDVIGNTAKNNGGGILNEAFEEDLILIDSTVSDNVAENDGGGIYYQGTDIGSTQEIKGSTLSRNKAKNGGGIYISVNSLEQITIENSSISDNEASGTEEGNGGGGLFNEGEAVLDNVMVSSNKATAANGGGIFSSEGSLGINNGSVIKMNTAFIGGGLFVANTAVVIQGGSSVSDNMATIGGGVYIGSGEAGDSAVVTLNNAFITENEADGAGGGVYVDKTTLKLEGAADAITSNTAGTDGGGIYNDGTVEGATDGGNVKDNTPDNIFNTP